MNAHPNNSGNVAMEVELSSAPTTVPMWLIVVTFVLLFFGAWYFDSRGGWFDPRVYGPYVSIPDLDRFQPQVGGEIWPTRGKLLFEQNCATCHNPDGMGKPGQAPPFAGSEWVLAAGVNRLVRIPQVGLNGPVEVKGQLWNLSMAGMGAPYSDEDLAAVISYIRKSWGNQGSVVSAEQVKKVRAELGSRSQPFTADELKKLPE